MYKIYLYLKFLNIIFKFRTHRKPFFFLEEDDVSMESEEEEEKKQPTSAVEDTVSKIIHKYCSSNKFRIHSLTKCVKFSNTKGFVSTFRIWILSDIFAVFRTLPVRLLSLKTSQKLFQSRLLQARRLNVRIMP